MYFDPNITEIKIMFPGCDKQCTSFVLDNGLAPKRRKVIIHAYSRIYIYVCVYVCMHIYVSPVATYELLYLSLFLIPASGTTLLI